MRWFVADQEWKEATQFYLTAWAKHQTGIQLTGLPHAFLLSLSLFFNFSLFFPKKVLPRGGPLEITKGGRGVVKIFQCTNFFSAHSSALFFFLALHEFSFQSLLAGNFFSDKFPLYNFLGVGGGGGIASKSLTYRPTYLPNHLPPFLIKMNAGRFLYESTKLLFPILFISYLSDSEPVRKIWGIS